MRCSNVYKTLKCDVLETSFDDDVYVSENLFSERFNLSTEFKGLPLKATRGFNGLTITEQTLSMQCSMLNNVLSSP